MDMQVKWRRGYRYLGGYYGLLAMSYRFVEPKVVEGVHDIKTLVKVAGEYLQTAYISFTCLLQSEWQYLSRAVTGVEAHLGPIEEAIRDVTIPSLLH